MERKEIIKDTQLQIRVNSDWKKEVKQKAKDDNKDVSEYVVSAVNEKMGRGE